MGIELDTKIKSNKILSDEIKNKNKSRK
jgi:hypothetical protein